MKFTKILTIVVVISVTIALLVACASSTDPLGRRSGSPLAQPIWINSRRHMMKVFVGDDWAEAHHDVHLMNDNGDKLATKRLPEGLDGIAGFHAMVADHVDDPSEVIIGIETDRGMWVQALIAARYTVFAINPLSVSRYRDRHNVAGAKSDPGDAKLLADLVRTDRHNHRSVAGDSDDVDRLKVLVRAHQNLIWDRTRHTNRLRNDLREYFPAALAAFDELSHGDAIGVLARTRTRARPGNSQPPRSGLR